MALGHHEEKAELLIHLAGKITSEIPILVLWHLAEMERNICKIRNQTSKQNKELPLDPDGTKA